ncbi:tetratricopeptide repeat protein [Puniceicoccus vermicola]|uniref:Tetratricopeptide repeat protein n=1 Tax=Puniceicoccus vermicola TaxID=388746 RepID=A0A7X1E2Q9_9BACT|nr:tetratricopeptide repeat protein [Puniceicoccus vermicola]MBC2600184.1 tetratricopeptide repeat protein [Puniceicoccus vermicola]
MKKALLPLALLSSCALVCAIPPAEELLQRLTSQDSAEGGGENSLEDWIAELDDSELDRSGADFATLWVEGFGQWSSFLTRDGDDRFGEVLMKNFPEPGAWRDISEDLSEGKPNAGKLLRFQIAVAEGNYEGAQEIIDSLAKLKSGGAAMRFLSRSRGNSKSVENYFWTLKTAAFHSVNTEFSQLALEDLLNFLGDPPPGYFRMWGVEFPDLENIFGAERSEEFLKSLFLGSESSVEVDQFVTEDQARIFRILMEGGVVEERQFQSFLSPKLPEFPEAVAYLESKHPSFPSAETRIDWVRDYLRMGKVEKVQEELEALQEESSSSFEIMVAKLAASAGYSYSTGDLYDSLEPFLPDLDPVLRLELQSGLMPLDPENDPILAQLDEKIDSSTSPTSELLLSRITRLFELGMVSEAVASLQEYLESSESFRLPTDADSSEEKSRLLRLTKAMDILDEQELFERLLAILEAKTEELSFEDDQYELVRMIEFFSEIGDTDAAVDLTVKWLEYSIQARKDSGQRYWYRGSPMAMLVMLYQQAGRPEEALLLLERSPFWFYENISEMRYVDLGELAFPVSVAQILIEIGKEEQGIELLRNYLATEGGADDLAFEVLVREEGEEAVPFLDQLLEMDPFEERPLIWKSVILLETGELEAAEEAARAAIAIDPTDGEMSARDRLRAYAVLGQVLAARGQEEEANTMARIVAAVDLAEEADELRIAGMTLPALEMYRESLQIFADAYCIQFRTGVELKSAGKIEEAEVHLRKAYGLMPHQFGRIESHCFGCEGAFRGEWEQDIALNVFNEMVEEEPENPTLYYLLGYLEDTRGNDAAALEAFATAVQMDPLYVNAWKKLLGVLDSLPIQENVELRKRAIQAMIELDPSSIRGIARDLPLEWFPLYWEEIQEGLARQQWSTPVDFPLGAEALPYDWGEEGNQSLYSSSRSDDDTLSAGRFFWESTDLTQQIMSNLMRY